MFIDFCHLFPLLYKESKKANSGNAKNGLEFGNVKKSNTASERNFFKRERKREREGGGRGAAKVRGPI